MLLENVILDEEPVVPDEEDEEAVEGEGMVDGEKKPEADEATDEEAV